MKKRINYSLVNILLLCFILFFIVETKDFLLEVFSFLKKILFPIFISLLLAYFLSPLLTFFKKKGLSHNLSFALTIILLILIFGLIIFLSYPVIVREGGRALKIIVDFINQFFSENSQLQQEIILKLQNVLSTFSDKIYTFGLDFVSSLINFFTNFILIIVLFFSFLYNFDKIKKYFLDLITNSSICNLVLDIDNDIVKYLKSIALIVVIETVEYSLIYYFIGHPNYLLIGFLAGFTTIVPFFGGVFTNIVALITAFSYSKKLFFLTALILIVVPILDNYLRDPKIYKSTIKISPLKSIIITVVASFTLGIFGMILAVPIYIVLNHLFKYFSKRWQQKRREKLKEEFNSN